MIYHRGFLMEAPLTFTDPINSLHWPTRDSDRLRVDPWASAVIALANLFAALSIALYWFMEYQGQILQLILVVASLVASVLLLSRTRSTRWWDLSLDGSFAFLAIVALSIWSSGFAFAVTLILPIISVLGIRMWLGLSGREIMLAKLNQVSQTHMLDAPNIEAGSDLPVEDIDPQNAIDDAAVVGDALAESESHPWKVVQDQFQEDDTLLQNVTQWEDAEGNRSVVANLRCHFRNAKETCVFHLPFWPLFEGDPEVFCRVAMGRSANIKTTQISPHGLRLEVQLDEGEDESMPCRDVVIEVVASRDSNAAECAA